MPIPWWNYSVPRVSPYRRANCGFLHSAARLPAKDLHAHPAAISSTPMIPRPTVSFLHFSSLARLALLSSSHSSVDSTPVGKFSSTLFINTDHLSRIARGSFSSLSTNNRLVKLLRERLSSGCARSITIDYRAMRVWIHARFTGCPENLGNFSRPRAESNVNRLYFNTETSKFPTRYRDLCGLLDSMNPILHWSSKDTLNWKLRTYALLEHLCLI